MFRPKCENCKGADPERKQGLNNIRCTIYHKWVKSTSYCADYFNNELERTLLQAKIAMSNKLYQK